jgi:hypothetical protein
MDLAVALAVQASCDALTFFMSLPFRLPEILQPEGLPEASEQPLKAIDWQKFGESVADWLASGIRHMHVRPLYATRKRYLTAPSRTMYDAVRRHFGHELTREDLELARKYAALVRRIRHTDYHYKNVAIRTSQRARHTLIGHGEN